MGIYGWLAKRSWNTREKLHLAHLRRRLHNHSFCLFTNNCVGGVICHNLNQPFRSPTVNPWMTAEGFLTFMNDLPFFLNCEIEQVFEEGIQYPIGRMRHGDSVVILYFMHYDSFQTAVEKWRVRASRVDLSNVYVILDYPGTNDTPETQNRVREKFDRLPFEKKAMLTNTSGVDGSNVFPFGFYDRDLMPGKILQRKNNRTVKRYIDDFDYVSFLNKK